MVGLEIRTNSAVPTESFHERSHSPVAQKNEHSTVFTMGSSIEQDTVAESGICCLLYLAESLQADEISISDLKVKS